MTIKMATDFSGRTLEFVWLPNNSDLNLNDQKQTRTHENK